LRVTRCAAVTAFPLSHYANGFSHSQQLHRMKTQL